MSKRAISATIDENLIKWVDKEVKDGIRYRNKSHLIEIAIGMLRNKKE